MSDINPNRSAQTPGRSDGDRCVLRSSGVICLVSYTTTLVGSILDQFTRMKTASPTTTWPDGFLPNTSPCDGLRYRLDEEDCWAWFSGGMIAMARIKIDGTYVPPR